MRVADESTFIILFFEKSVESQETDLEEFSSFSLSERLISLKLCNECNTRSFYLLIFERLREF